MKNLCIYSACPSIILICSWKNRMGTLLFCSIWNFTFLSFFLHLDFSYFAFGIPCLETYSVSGSYRMREREVFFWFLWFGLMVGPRGGKWAG